LLDSEFVTHHVLFEIHIVLLPNLDLQRFKLDLEQFNNWLNYISDESHLGQVWCENVLIHQVAVKITFNLTEKEETAVND